MWQMQHKIAPVFEFAPIISIFLIIINFVIFSR